MKITDDISKMIEEEISDAQKYIHKALEIHESYPELAQILYTISNEEMGHMNMLHNAAMEINDNVQDAPPDV